MAARLREQTWPLHQSLDRHPRFRAFVQPGLRDDYDQALAGLACGWVPLEYHLQQRLRSEPDQLRYLFPRRQALLEDLGQPASPAQENGAGAWLAGSPLPAAIGALYVLNGGQLGSQHIARTLERHQPDWPCRFFRLHATDPSQQWPAFVGALDQWLETEAQQQECVEGARRTFRDLINALDSARES